MTEPVLLELTRITARISATLFAAALLTFAARRRVPTRIAVRVFAAFIAAHAVHFSAVFLLAYATSGANLRARGGYALTVAVGVLFGASAVAGLLRLRASEPGRGLRLAGGLGIAFIWFAFTQAYVSRAFVSPVFAMPAIVLLVAFVAFLNESRHPNRGL